MKNKLFLILLGVGIVANAITLIRLSIDRKRFINNMEFCIEVSSQCGIHNIIEENEINDESIDQNILWLKYDEFDLSDYENETGIKILKYLRKKSYENREKVMSNFYNDYLEDQDG